MSSEEVTGVFSGFGGDVIMVHPSSCLIDEPPVDWFAEATTPLPAIVITHARERKRRPG